MRWVVAVALAVSFLSVPAARAQDDTLHFALDDATGDAGPTSQATGFVDLVHADVAAMDDRLEVRIQVASLDTDHPAYWAGCELWLTFEYRGTTFDAVLFPKSHQVTTPVDGKLVGGQTASLFRGADGTFALLGTLGSGLDVSSRTFNATIPWSLVTDPSDFSPRPGESIHLLGVHSYYSPLVTSPHSQSISIDRQTPLAPVAVDEAHFPDGTAFIVPGSVGDLSLATPLAVRYSNGEATTLQWPVEVTNHGARDLDVALSMAAAPGTDARLPESVHVVAGGNKTVSVYVTMPFAHEHGSSRHFPLTASTSFGDRTTLQLAVDYPAVPQPAGHHPDLYIHTMSYKIAGQPSLPGPVWMNALEDDPKADGTPTSGGFWTCPTSDGVVPGTQDGGEIWEVPLDPALRIGLDGRLGEKASLDLALSSQAIVPPGTVYARLRLVNDTDSFFTTQTLADGDPYVGHGSAAGGGQTATAHVDIPMPPELGLVPPSLHKDLDLVAIYCPTVPTAASFAAMSALGFVDIFHPVIALTGGHLVLPLNEYHDVIAVEPGAGPTLSVDQAVVHARSGATVLWRAGANFPQGDQATYAVRLLGAGAAQAILHSPDRVRAGDGPANLPVSLVVPDGPAGQVVDVVLDLTSTMDPGDTAALHLAVLIDPAATLDQASEVAALGMSSHHRSPGVEPWLLVAALAVVAAFRRRL